MCHNVLIPVSFRLYFVIGFIFNKSQLLIVWCLNFVAFFQISFDRWKVNMLHLPNIYCTILSTHYAWQARYKLTGISVLDIISMSLRSKWARIDETFSLRNLTSWGKTTMSAMVSNDKLNKTGRAIRQQHFNRFRLNPAANCQSHLESSEERVNTKATKSTS